MRRGSAHPCGSTTTDLVEHQHVASGRWTRRARTRCPQEHTCKAEKVTLSSRGPAETLQETQKESRCVENDSGIFWALDSANHCSLSACDLFSTSTSFLGVCISACYRPVLVARAHATDHETSSFVAHSSRTHADSTFLSEQGNVSLGHKISNSFRLEASKPVTYVPAPSPTLL